MSPRPPSQSHDEGQTLLEGIYDFCKTGSHFERLCRALLEAMGLGDVVVTGRPGDGGIDLVCTREGVEGLSAADSITYRIQAKRCKPGLSVTIQAVRALRGILVPPEKGIFITTGRFTKSALDFLEQDPSRPVILIDGDRLVELCVRHALGVEFRPVFNPDRLLRQIELDSPLSSTTPEAGHARSPDDEAFPEAYTTRISRNDVRSMILPLPGNILNQLPESSERLVVWIDGKEESLRFNRSRRYVSGIAAFFRRAGLMDDDGTNHCGLAAWRFDPKLKRAKVTVARTASPREG
jgi:hypothetical protein